MKPRRKAVRAVMAPPERMTNQFLRGFATTGLLLAVCPGERPPAKQLLRHALRGGTALAAGVATANAIDRRDYGGAALSLALGAAGIAAIDALMEGACAPHDDKEIGNGQEETA